DPPLTSPDKGLRIRPCKADLKRPPGFNLSEKFRRSGCLLIKELQLDCTPPEETGKQETET
ncbi:MAG TPA: hypothetical protein VFZ38_12510, partial [Vicinamibacterales bacterium]